MSENIPDPKGQKDPKGQEPEKKDEKKDGENNIPYHRFKEVNDAKDEAERKLKELQDKLDADESKKLEEEGKHKELAEREKARADSLAEENARIKRENAIVIEATKAGIKDTEAAVKLINSDLIKSDKDGKLSGVDEAVKNLVETRPYLVEGGDNQKVNIGSGSNPPDGNDKKRYPLSWVREKWADVSWTKAKHSETGELTGAEFLEKIESDGLIDQGQ